MKKHTHFNACPNCNRLMSWQTDKQKCPNCGHEEPLNYTRPREAAKDDPILDALRTLQTAVNEISGHWTESIDNAMQQADLAIDKRTKAMLQLGMAKEEGVSVPSLIENAEVLVGIAQDELVAANATTKSGLAGLLLIALIGQITCVRSRLRAILAAVNNDADFTEEGKTDEQAS
jgi:DNA-directed RNA polymerase subunit M/transcription elongation factor TFIIS